MIFLVIVFCTVTLIACGGLFWEVKAKSTALKITAADFNGSDWDGSPLESLVRSRKFQNLAWFKEKVEEGKIRLAPSDTDYAVWLVITPFGEKTVWPGNIIYKMGKWLFVSEKRW